MIRAVWLALALAAGLVVPNAAAAWWALWPEPAEEAADPVPVPANLHAARASDCASDGAGGSRFADNAFARHGGVLPSALEDARPVLAALRLAASPAQAEALAAGLLTAPDGAMRAVAAVALARVLLARADLWEGAEARAASLLAGLDGPDALYLRAVLASRTGDWDGAARLTERALAADPRFHDAAVLHALARTRAASAAALGCGGFIASLDAALAPVFASGACPVHVAHLDLAARRFVETAPGRTGQRDRALWTLALAYVSRNDRVCRQAAGTLSAQGWGQRCAPVLAQLDCATPP